MDESTAPVTPPPEDASCPCRTTRWLRIGLLLVILVALAFVAWNRWQRIRLNQEETLRDVLEVVAQNPLPFPVTNALVPLDQIMSGGPPKDGIPSLTLPARVPNAEMSDLTVDARVIGVSVEGESVAYPLGLLNWHECVNDVVGGIPVAVTYCPLCDSAVVFDRRVGGETLEFGISGLLHNSNVLLYDRQASPEAESLWSQVQFRAIAGPRAGQMLSTLPLEMTSWESWRRSRPEGQVVAFPEPPMRNYAQNPYADYFTSSRLMFPVSPLDDRLATKTRVVGLATETEALALPLEALRDGEQTIVFAGGEVTITRDAESGGVAIGDLPPGVRATHTFWFAWSAMHPGTALSGADQGSGIRQGI